MFVIDNYPLSYMYTQAYSSKDLSGLKVEHSTEAFREGRDTVLTLKDKGIDLELENLSV